METVSRSSTSSSQRVRRGGLLSAPPRAIYRSPSPSSITTTDIYTYIPPHRHAVPSTPSPPTGERNASPQAPANNAALLTPVLAMDPLRHALRQRYLQVASIAAARRDPEQDTIREDHGVDALQEQLDTDAQVARLRQRNAEWLAGVQAAAERRREERRRLTREQAEDKIQWQVDRHLRRYGQLWRRRGESDGEWVRRTDRLSSRVIRAWENLRLSSEMISAGDGGASLSPSPLREGYGDVSVAGTDGPPRVMPHFTREPTGRGTCLRCAAEGMSCSRTSVYPGQESGQGCSRCARVGRGCLVKLKDDRGRSQGKEKKVEERMWRYVKRPRDVQEKEEEMAGKAEERAEVRELLRKRDGLKTVVVGGEVVDAQVGNFVLPQWWF